jgi:hypothetical protein
MKDKSLVMHLYHHVVKLVVSDSFEITRDTMGFSITTRTQLLSMTHALELLETNQGNQCGILMDKTLDFIVNSLGGSWFYWFIGVSKYYGESFVHFFGPWDSTFRFWQYFL